MTRHRQTEVRASFPSPEERERIIERRNALSYALYLNLALRETDPAGADARLQELIREYGLSEVQRMMDRIERHAQAQRPTGDAENEWLYHNYVERYRRWGGQRSFLAMADERRLNYERTILKTRQDYHAGRFDPGLPMQLPPLSPAEERRQADLTDLLLADADLWDDLVPDDPPAVMPPLPARPAQPDHAEPAWPQSPPRARLHDLVLRGDRLAREGKSIAACGYWLEAWAIIRPLVRPEHRSAEALMRARGLTLAVSSWAVELSWELGNAAIDDPAYNEQQLGFSREYLDLFPDSDPTTVVNMLRAQGEALWRMGRRTEAETTYKTLVERLPDEGWGYIGWSDQYWWMGQKDAPPEYELGETILKLALIRPSLRDRADVLERLAELYGKWGKPDEQARVTAQLAKLRQGQGERGRAPTIRVPAPASKGRPGRNEPCWCGSGRKYKHCHLQSDQAR